MSKKNCVSCKQDILEDHHFCMHCGINQPEEIKCSNCGHQIREKSNFCENCGSKMGLLEKRHKLHVFLTIILTIIVASIALRIHIVRILILFVPVLIVWGVYSILRKLT